jgi:serine/threonine protein kinase
MSSPPEEPTEKPSLMDTEGWYGVAKPAPAVAGPAVPSREGRKKLEVQPTAIDRAVAGVFQGLPTSDRVWWSAEDEEAERAAAEEYAFTVEVEDSHPVREHYEVGDVVRRSDFFVIRSAHAKGDPSALFSIKCVDLNMAQMLGQDPVKLAAEVELFKEVGKSCTSVLSSYAEYTTESVLCVVLEAAAGSELLVQLGRGGDAENFSLADAYSLGKQILTAVAAVHAAGIIHRDVTDYSFVFMAKDSIDRLYLSDFSFAIKEASFTGNPGGAEEFQAPEMHADGDVTCSAAVDVWSAGVLLFIVLSGSAPFANFEDRDTLLDTIRSGTYEWPASAKDEVPAPLRAVVDKMLTVSAAARPSSADSLKEWEAQSVSSDVTFSSFKKNLRALQETR